MAAPYGRGMLTFATVPALSQESFSIPKMDLSVRLMPYNVLLTTDQHKPHRESSDWSEFHNGVAAGLRITPSSQMVANSWIAFNKPTDLTPQHAGFLMALGLTGHLKEMLTWQTFGYLTPKHDFTSIGVLLGLSAAHVGTGNDHVTKLLAVHAPALLPHQDVDLNVPLVTQSAALAGLGLLYMATKKRHMAEVLLHEIHRRDLAQPDLVNEHREAYTLASGISFGMVMLGKGTNVPTDNDMVERLRILIHGPSPPSTEAGSFDLNLTSPAATIALGLMYLRTGRVDIANVLAVPEAIIELHRLQPAFLMTRTLAKALVMWSTIEASNEWLSGQVPPLLVKAMDAHLKTGSTLDDTLALAYYYIITGACFALALKFAGSNSVPAVTMLTLQYDAYMNLMMKQGASSM
jgi:anaphase-promoting complex subunit 1